MIPYKQFNVNPKGKKTDDCSIRALATAIEIPYHQVMQEMFDISMKTGYAFGSMNVIERILKYHGFVKHKQPRKSDGTKYLVGEIDRLCFTHELEMGVVISLAHHLTATTVDIDTDLACLQDTWDCRYKTIGNFWTRS